MTVSRKNRPTPKSAAQPKPSSHKPQFSPPSASSQHSSAHGGTMLSFAKSASELSQRAVAEAAYFLWLQRGGDQLSNWLEAEAKLRKTLKRSA